MNPFKFLLFDLDGTLIEFKLEDFITTYLGLIRKQFVEYHFANDVPNWLMAGTELMLSNDGSMTNREKFVRYFSARTGLDEAQLWKIFIHFYQTDFKEISRITTKVTGIRDLLKQAIASGYRLILATQPVFPEIAIRQRMSWAGVDDLEFEFVTDIDSMNACKPSPVYYRQILERLAAQPADCLMIGNDPVTDVGAGKVGIRTFLLNNGTDENGCPADFCGSLNDLARLLRLETEQVG